jgi:hypothetical protein
MSKWKFLGSSLDLCQEWCFEPPYQMTLKAPHIYKGVVPERDFLNHHRRHNRWNWRELTDEELKAPRSLKLRCRKQTHNRRENGLLCAAMSDPYLPFRERKLKKRLQANPPRSKPWKGHCFDTQKQATEGALDQPQIPPPSPCSEKKLTN